MHGHFLDGVVDVDAALLVSGGLRGGVDVVLDFAVLGAVAADGEGVGFGRRRVLGGDGGRREEVAGGEGREGGEDNEGFHGSLAVFGCCYWCCLDSVAVCCWSSATWVVGRRHGEVQEICTERR